ncbi:hypothetical protein BKA70DRAFT_1219435 [Coprinopsis sp. MPI-PUGE-AT-0042]|nr:hypothetical protein BKA70DRAFT_1219435 [Coprinopsis sp. MPI-PUGE-AT-0042]
MLALREEKLAGIVAALRRKYGRKRERENCWNIADGGDRNGLARCQGGGGSSLPLDGHTTSRTPVVGLGVQHDDADGDDTKRFSGGEHAGKEARGVEQRSSQPASCAKELKVWVRLSCQGGQTISGSRRKEPQATYPRNHQLWPSEIKKSVVNTFNWAPDDVTARHVLHLVLYRRVYEAPPDRVDALRYGLD